MKNKLASAIIKAINEHPIRQHQAMIEFLIPNLTETGYVQLMESLLAANPKVPVDRDLAELLTEAFCLGAFAVFYTQEPKHDRTSN